MKGKQKKLRSQKTSFLLVIQDNSNLNRLNIPFKQSLANIDINSSNFQILTVCFEIAYFAND
jgi:hypothetical protein